MKKKLFFSTLLLSSFSFINVLAAPGGGGTTAVNDSTGNVCDGIATACGLPEGLVLMINDFYNLLKIAVPIVLVIMGMIDLLKAVASQKEDEIKKGWQVVVKRTLTGILVFFVFFMVQVIVDLLPTKVKSDSVMNCVKCIFTNTGECPSGCITTGANTGA